MRSHVAGNASTLLSKSKAAPNSSSNKRASGKFAPKSVCHDLLGADSEEEVQAILDSSPAMCDPRNWRPLDRRETNFNITSNQASDGGKALTELMTNMVDAVLLKRARERNID